MKQVHTDFYFSLNSWKLLFILSCFYDLFCNFYSLFHFNFTAGAYYPTPPQYPTSVQPSTVMLSTQQQLQVPPPQQAPAQSQGLMKRERRPVVCPNKSTAHLLNEVKNVEWRDTVLCVQCGTFPFNLKTTIVFVMMGVSSCRSVVAGWLHIVCILMSFAFSLIDNNTRPQPGWTRYHARDPVGCNVLHHTDTTGKTLLWSDWVK